MDWLRTHYKGATISLTCVVFILGVFVASILFYRLANIPLQASAEDNPELYDENIITINPFNDKVKDDSVTDFMAGKYILGMANQKIKAKTKDVFYKITPERMFNCLPTTGELINKF